MTTPTDGEWPAADLLGEAGTGGAVDGLPAPAGRLVDGLLWAGAAIPGLALVLLGTLVLRARSLVGDWPTRDQPDPKELGIHNTATLLLVLASFLAVVVVPAGTLAAFAAGRRRVDIRPLIVVVALFSLIAVVLWGDPGGIGQWFVD